MRVSPEAQQTAEQIERVITADPEAATAEDRQTTINALVQYDGMSEPEADHQLAQWQAAYGKAKQEALEAAEASADAVARGAFSSFFALALGAVIALCAGLPARPGTPPWRGTSLRRRLAQNFRAIEDSGKLAGTRLIASRF